MMNKLTILVLIFFTTLMACKPVTKESSSLVFSGTIENPNRSGFTISGNDFEQEISLDSSGNFKADLEGIREGSYTLWDSVESTKIYLIPGLDLQLTMKADSFDESIKYEGPGADASNYLADKYRMEEKMNLDYKGIYSMDEKEFLTEIAKIEKELMAFLESYKSLPGNFYEMEAKSVKYAKLGLMSNYQGAHAYYTKNKDFKPSDNFLDPLKDIDYNSELDFNKIDAYKRLVISNYTSGDIMDNIAKLDDITVPAIKKEVLKSLQYSMRPGMENLDEVFEGISAHAVDEDFKVDLVSKYETYKELAKGKVSPGFSFPDVEGKVVNLNDLEGKVVYIDVWATWCGPCLAEIPYLKELEEELHEENLAFVSISVDKEKDKGKWENMIAEKQLKGYQLFSDKDWKSDFVKAYGIQGIPRFILIDKAGKIISPDAPRPSSGDEIRSMIAEAL